MGLQDDSSYGSMKIDDEHSESIAGLVSSYREVRVADKSLCIFLGRDGRCLCGVAGKL